MRYRRPAFTNPLTLLLPGLLVLGFALAAIVLPVGSNGLGRGVDGGLAGWARELHDGFWRVGHRLATCATGGGAHARARALCATGQAEAAIAAYKHCGVLTAADHNALFELAEALVVDGRYDVAEWYVREADRLMDSATLRNNLAWHYTQTNQRHQAALNLALASVADDREPFNIDTLAWAYYRDGQTALAAKVAQEVLDLPSSSWSYSAPQLRRGQESSRRLLKLLGR